LFCTFLLVLALASARQLVISPSHGQDFRDFFAAGTLVAQGRDPYDVSALVREQDTLYNQPDHLKPGDRAFYDGIPYPQGPWVAMALAPFSGLPWQAAYLLYLLSAISAIAAAAWAFLNLLGWAGRARLLAVGATVLSPVAFINLFQGQPVPFLLAAFAAAWTLLHRGRSMLAGMVLAIAWIKPHIGLPLVVVLGILHPTSIRRFLLGFAVGSAMLFAIAALVLRGGLLEWPGVVLGQWSGPLQQADLASINALYYPALHGALRLVTLVVVLALAVAYAAWIFRQRRPWLLRGMTVLLLTIAAAPYAHSYDALLLLPVVLVLLRSGQQGWARPRVEIALWAFAIFPLLYFAGLHIGSLNGFTSIPVVLLGLAWLQDGKAVAPEASVGVAA